MLSVWDVLLLFQMEMGCRVAGVYICRGNLIALSVSLCQSLPCNLSGAGMNVAFFICITPNIKLHQRERLFDSNVLAMPNGSAYSTQIGTLFSER